MKNRNRGALAAGLAVVAVVVPVVVRAPEPALSLPHDVRNLDEALDDCLGTRLDGWALVDYATHLVNQKFSRFSVWHLWEGSSKAFRNSRGYSEQYNLALARVLAGLGFEVQVVHADRVRFDTERTGAPGPWHGHTWLRVEHAGDTLDVCASRADNTAGAVRFKVLSEVRPSHPWSGLKSRLMLAGPVVARVWTSWLTGRPVPRWVFRGFHDQG